MAIRHLYTIACDYLIVAQDGKPTPAGVFHNIAVKQFPAGKDPLGFIIALTGEGGETFRVTLEGPSGNRLVQIAEGVLARPSALQEHQQWVHAVAGTATPAVFEEPGVYRIVVWEDEEEIHSYPFGVFQVGDQDEEADDG